MSTDHSEIPLTPRILLPLQLTNDLEPKASRSPRKPAANYLNIIEGQSWLETPADYTCIMFTNLKSSIFLLPLPLHHGASLVPLIDMMWTKNKLKSWQF